MNDPFAELNKIAQQVKPTQVQPSQDPVKALGDFAGVKNDTIQPTNTQPIEADKPVVDLNTLPANPNTGSSDYNGYCQAFVEQATGSGWKGSSAYDAWSRYANQGQAIQGTDGIKKGDLIYFAPDNSNENEGHVGIYEGNDKFISATDNGIEDNNLSDWQNLTGQQVLGYVRGGKQ